MHGFTAEESQVIRMFVQELYDTLAKIFPEEELNMDNTSMGRLFLCHRTRTLLEFKSKRRHKINDSTCGKFAICKPTREKGFAGMPGGYVWDRDNEICFDLIEDSFDKIIEIFKINADIDEQEINLRRNQWS